jgi:cellulose synthase/poly-beta-1,6-N-acetylglucosamine synthase-like glycosyltransferase
MRFGLMNDMLEPVIIGMVVLFGLFQFRMVAATFAMLTIQNVRRLRPITAAESASADSNEARSTDRPVVAVQVAVYREAPALPVLFESLRQLNWPVDRLRIQVLDDSTGDDATSTREIVELHAASGMPVTYHNRGSRSGFKAGALNYGMIVAGDAQLIAYFDADCLPRPYFLERLVPRVLTPGVAAVQARWEYPNDQHNPLTAVQAAAFEALFTWECALRARLGLPVYYLGTNAIWRLDVLAELGGWREQPFTAEDVDMGCRAAALGFDVSYEPEVLAENDAIEDLLAFRAQQRRWTRAVGRAALDAIKGLHGVRRSFFATLTDWTSLMPHATIPLTLLLSVAIALDVLLGGIPSGALEATLWVASALFVFPPAGVALLLAVRKSHPGNWILRWFLLLRAGPVAAATMTSFIFGLADLAFSIPTEFVVTPKAGQHATIANSSEKWLRSFTIPIAVDAAIFILLLSGFVHSIAAARSESAVPLGIMTWAYGRSMLLSLIDYRAHRRRLDDLFRCSQSEASQ